MAQPLTLKAYFDSQAQDLTDRCTRCGKCVEVCPILQSEYSPLKEAQPVEVVTGVVEFLRGGPLPREAQAWTEACMGSGECITHCPEHINPRLMLAIALSRLRAAKSQQGDNPFGDYFKRMSQIIKLATGMQMTPEAYRRLLGQDGRKARAEVVMYLGCNVLRTPVIAFSVLDILDRLGVDYAVVAGVANCCGMIHLKLHGDVEHGEVIAGGTLAKLASLRPEKVLHWCPTCVMQFGETIAGWRPQAFAFEHFSDYLVDRLDALRAMFVAPVRRRVALHRHEGGFDVYRNVERLLQAIPGVEIVPIVEPHHLAYSCGPGGLGNVPAAREESHRQTLRSAVAAGAEILLTLYHTCHRDLCVFEGQYPLEVKNWTGLLAAALGLQEHEDRYKRYKLYSDINAILEDAKEFLAAHKLDVSGIREVLPGLLAGKERGLSAW
ncbi:MAG: (Fe-S)-binding protein [Candidatus Rokubacteria bacterium]|nr:(Fe-S)-binding protein [Candidatus Rokubacteria bacterium]